MNKTLSLYLKSFLLSVTVFLIWLAIYEVSTHIILKFHEARKLTGGYGYAHMLLVLYSAILFGILILMANIFFAIYKHIAIIKLGYTFIGILMIFLHLYFLSTQPLRSLQLITIDLIITFCMFWFGVFILRQYSIKKAP